jgi:hypothetical protein
VISGFVMPDYHLHITLTSAHLITLSARASTFSGIVRPICLAVFKLITNSSFIGGSTGRSAGFAPFKILRPTGAARPHRSEKSGPSAHLIGIAPFAVTT